MIRRAMIAIRPHELAALISLKQQFPGATGIRTSYDFDRDVVLLSFEHPDLPEVGEGEPAPSVDFYSNWRQKLGIV
jgi:hypothetical protein